MLITDAKESFSEDKIFGSAIEFNDVRVEVEVVEDVIAVADDIGVRFVVLTAVEVVVAITTIEAIETDPVGARVVEAWVKHEVAQCGYCQSGQVMATVAMLRENPRATAEDAAYAISNLCRCGTYNAIDAALADLTSKA